MEGSRVFMIDQNKLPFHFKIASFDNYLETCRAIRDMTVRGAGAIGSAAGFAMAQASLMANEQHYEHELEKARKEIEGTRPTARNLFYAVERVFTAALKSTDQAAEEALSIADQDAKDSLAIGQLGMELIPDRARIGTHCNAGWLAFTDFGTALSPIYLAHEAGKKVFVYIDETRPRSQGARLTAWELNNAGIEHVIIPDNATAHFLSRGDIHLMIVGADRIAANGDVANKIGTLEKALAAKRYGVPFYVAAPSSTFDLLCEEGTMIDIELRSEAEVLYVEGPDDQGIVRKIRTASPGSHALNPAFDITPVDLLTGIITEKGIIENPSKQSIEEVISG
jgi:S-methyl-5-thioribose-1-phosphate isomerase